MLPKQVSVSGQRLISSRYEPDDVFNRPISGRGVRRGRRRRARGRRRRLRPLGRDARYFTGALAVGARVACCRLFCRL